MLQLVEPDCIAEKPFQFEFLFLAIKNGTFLIEFYPIFYL